jgi:hypothetical protein
MEELCYKCKHHGHVANSRHSSCRHPEAQRIVQSGETLMALMKGYVEKSRVNQVTAIKVEAEPHGIQNGWFVWPFNFDPLWLKSCNGFEEE